MIPTRLVAFATVGGRPKKISTGRVRNDPPPATTFNAPAARPAAKSARKPSQGSTAAIGGMMA
jgi:hypothetical protein